MKKKVVLMSLISALALSGCSFSSFTGTKASAEQPLVPKDALVAIEDSKVSLGVCDITISDGFTVGSGEFTDSTSNSKFNLTGVWKTIEKEEAATEVSANEVLTPTEDVPNVDYKEAVDNDILFYVMSGEDNTSPDKELDKGEVKTSLTTYTNYLSTLLSMNFPKIDDITLNDSEGNPIVDEQGKISARTSSDGNWYYTTFTATSGEKVTTTYNTLCYPKSYYGVMVMGTNQNPDYSRKYFIFVFSNDSQGEIMNESAYNSLFTQIKSNFKLHGFYTMPQLSTEKDPATNYYNGRSYEQFNDLMQDTFNYYILKNNSNTVSDAEDVTLEENNND